MYQIHCVQIGAFRQKTAVIDRFQKNTHQFSLCAFQCYHLRSWICFWKEKMPDGTYPSGGACRKRPPAFFDKGDTACCAHPLGTLAGREVSFSRHMSPKMTDFDSILPSLGGKTLRGVPVGEAFRQAVPDGIYPSGVVPAYSVRIINCCFSFQPFQTI